MPETPINPTFRLPSPLQLIQSKELDKKGLQLWIKRDDLIHPLISGNKWRKLKYNIRQMQEERKNGMITFGGAYSNHIYATAAAGRYFGFPTIGIIRGEASQPLNATLSFAQNCGMQLHFVSRTAYRDKSTLSEQLDLPWKDSYLLPEGGTNGYALPGCAEIVEEVSHQLEGRLPDYWCLSCGTGGTTAGLIAGLEGKSRLIAFSALKGDFHRAAIATLLQEQSIPSTDNWQVNTQYHFGGYARYKPELIEFMKAFYQQYTIPLDPIYTGKLFYGLFDLIEQSFFPKDSILLAIHTGGLQGNRGFADRFKLHLPE